MPPLVVNQSNSALITNKNQMYSDKNLHLHAGFGYMSKNCFIAYFSCHLHSFMFYKRLLEQKLISCLEISNPLQGWVNSVGKRMETAGTVYLSNVVITSVRPLLKSQAFELLMVT